MTQDPVVSTQLDESWRGIDKGWGRRAVDAFPPSANRRTLSGVRGSAPPTWRGRKRRTLLDVACGAGLAIELARLRGALCAGIDASERLVAVARDRNPHADLRVGDMQALPWDDGAFDVVTSFRGIWGTTPEAIAEVCRVLVPGGRVGLTVWGSHQGLSGRLGSGTLLSRREPQRWRTKQPWWPSAVRGRGRDLPSGRRLHRCGAHRRFPLCSSSPIQSSTHEPWRRPVRLF